MSMFDPDDGRWSHGMSTERVHPWHGEHLQPQPVAGAEGIAGMVTVVTLHDSDHGVTYEQCEPVGNGWHRATFSGPVSNLVRPA